MRFAICLTLALLAGCSTLEAAFANRVSCSPDRLSAFFTSLYWRLGISAKVDEADAKKLCAEILPPVAAASAPK